MLIDHWRKAYKYSTVQLAAALALISQVYDYLPLLQQYIPHNYVTWIAIAIVIARIVAQPKIAAKESEKEGA